MQIFPFVYLLLLSDIQAWTYVSKATKSNYPFGIAHLEVKRRNNLSSRCTGVVIANHTVLTAAHCIDDYPVQVIVEMNRSGPYNNRTCSTGFWNPKRKQCIKRVIMNYKVNKYFEENGLAWLNERFFALIKFSNHF